MAVNWNMLAAYPNAGEAFAQSFEKQQELNKQNMARSAMAALVQDPNNPRALAALAQVDPATAMQFRQQQVEQNKALLAQHQDSIIKGAKILRQFNPKDQASYTAALQAAQSAGIDVSQVPQQYNPQYVDGVIHIADAMAPENNDGDQVVVTPQPGAPALIYNKKTGQSQMIVGPNDGSHSVGTPMGGQPITATGPNGQKIQLNPQSGQWEPIGGPTPQASGGFPQ